MSWAPTELQISVYNVLSNDSALTTLLGGAGKIFDHVPDSSPYPYVKMAVKPLTDRGNESWDGVNVEVKLSVWYQAAGLGDLKVQQIQKRIDELLHNVSISINGWNIIAGRRKSVDIMDQPDGRTKHGLQLFNYLLGG